MTEAEALDPERSARAWLPAMLLIAAVFAWVAPTLCWLEFNNTPENLNVATAQEMRRGGPWLVPNLQGELRAAKPPLAAWITAALIRPETMKTISSPDALTRNRGFIELEWETRCPALVAMCILLVAVFGLARTLGGDTLALVSVAICGTNFMFLRFGRLSTTDVQLSLWVSIADWLLAIAIIRGRAWVGFIGAAIALSLAMLAKGPVCLVQSALPVALFALWRGWSNRRHTLVATDEKPRSRKLPLAIGIVVFFALATPWFIYVAMKHDVIHIWYTEVTRVHARDLPPDPWYMYFVIFAYIAPWIAFFVVGLIVLTQETFAPARRAMLSPSPGTRGDGGGEGSSLGAIDHPSQHNPHPNPLPGRERGEGANDVLALFLVVVPIVIMSCVRDKEDRYLLPMIGPVSIIAARGVMEHLKSWARWKWEDTLVVALHWLAVVVIVVGLPIIGSLTSNNAQPKSADQVSSVLQPEQSGKQAERFAAFKRVDGSPWYEKEFAYPAAFTALVLIGFAIYLHRIWRGTLVLATFMLMLITQVIFMAGYAQSKLGHAETRPLAEGIASLYPDAEVYNAHPEGKRPPSDVGIYLNRTIPWVENPETIAPSSKPQILLMLQNAGEAAPKAPPGWDLLDVKPRDEDFWYVFVRTPKEG